MFPQLGENREERKKMGPLVPTEDKSSQMENPQTKKEMLKKTSWFPVQAGANTSSGRYYGLPWCGNSNI